MPSCGENVTETILVLKQPESTGKVRPTEKRKNTNAQMKE